MKAGHDQQEYQEDDGFIPAADRLGFFHFTHLGVVQFGGGNQLVEQNAENGADDGGR
ncbi:MAG: hypothetical protein ACLU9S_03635 [Oscillospiraceae bacterium]